MEPLYHITQRGQFEEARAQGVLSPASLASEGFVHCSYGSQVLWVANLLFKGQTDLLVLELDSEKLTSELKIEHVPEADIWFPHLFGPIPLAAVQATIPLPPEPDGGFAWPSHGSTQPEESARLLAAYEWYDHPEGPKFVETHRNSERTSGHWLFLPGAISAFHRVQNNDELWLIQRGRLLVHTVDDAGHHVVHRLGTDPERGERPVLEVKKNCLQAAELPFGEAFAFGSNVCAPAFSFDELTIRTAPELSEMFPPHAGLFQRLARPAQR